MSSIPSMFELCPRDDISCLPVCRSPRVRMTNPCKTENNYDTYNVTILHIVALSTRPPDSQEHALQFADFANTDAVAHLR